jgi:hypothetical protein
MHLPQHQGARRPILQRATAPISGKCAHYNPVLPVVDERHENLMLGGTRVEFHSKINGAETASLCALTYVRRIVVDERGAAP